MLWSAPIASLLVLMELNRHLPLQSESVAEPSRSAAGEVSRQGAHTSLFPCILYGCTNQGLSELQIMQFV